MAGLQGGGVLFLLLLLPLSFVSFHFGVNFDIPSPCYFNSDIPIRKKIANIHAASDTNACA